MKRRSFLLAGSLLGLPSAQSATLLKVGAALPDPPFEFFEAGHPAGFDIVLMQRIAARLNRQWQLVPYDGTDFDGIFAGLADDSYDCVASGTTITPARERIADFCDPYITSGQSLVVDPQRHPAVYSIKDLQGLVIGVQQGNTSQPVAERLVAEGRAARVKVYAYDQIETALSDLETGDCDVFMKLAPVTAWFVRTRPKLKLVQTGITTERLAICVRKGNMALRDQINRVQASMHHDGSLAALVHQWLGSGASL